MNRADIKLIIDRCYAHDLPDAADLIASLADRLVELRETYKKLILRSTNKNESLRQQLGAAPDQALELQAERDTFYMDYRIKCDKQTKALQVEVEFMRQQLATITAERDEAVSAVQRLSDGQPFDAVVIADTVKRRTEQLEKQLAAAQAACKQKNKALLEYAMGDKTKYYVDPEGTIEAKPADAIALAIQPDNSALKAFADTKEN